MEIPRIGLVDPVTRRLRVRGPADPDEVWERYRRTERWSEWSPQIRRVEYPPGELTAGTSGRVHGPLGLRLRFDVLEVARPQWRWRVHVGRVPVEMTHTVTPHRRGTEASWSVEGPPWVLGYLPVAWRALRRLVAD